MRSRTTALAAVLLLAACEPSGEVRTADRPEFEVRPQPLVKPLFTPVAVVPPSGGNYLPPLAPQALTAFTLFGRRYTDPYAWLKQPAGATASWAELQMRFSRRVLDALPGRAQTLSRVRDYKPDPTRASELRAGGKRLFYVRPFSGAGPFGNGDVMMLEAGAPDPHLLRSLMVRANLVRLAPSPDGKFVAVECVGAPKAIEIVEPGVKEDLGVTLPGLAGSVAWSPKGDVLFYAAEQGGELVVRAHKIGAPVAEDRAIFGRGVLGPQLAAKDALITIAVGKKTLTITGTNGTARNLRGQYTATLNQVAAGSVPWRVVPLPADDFVDTSHGDTRVDISAALASPNEITGTDLTRADAKPIVLVPTSGAPRRHTSAADALYYSAPHEVARVSYDGRRREKIDLPPGVVAGAIIADPLQPGARVLLGSCLRAGWYSVSATSKTPTLLPIDVPTFDTSALEVAHEPLSVRGRSLDVAIVRAKGAPHAPAPALLLPSRCLSFLPSLASWITRGGVVGYCDVVAPGLSQSSEVVVDMRREQADDFRACAHKMIDAGHATRIGAFGQSEDALILTNAMLLEPALFAAVTVGDGIFDPSAAAVTTLLPERLVPATSTTSAYAASMPYFEIATGPYPPFLLIVSNRVDGGGSYRMAAALQVAAPDRIVALLDHRRISDNGSNGPDGRAEAWADTEGFFRLTLLGEGAPALPNFVRNDDAARSAAAATRP